ETPRAPARPVGAPTPGGAAEGRPVAGRAGAGARGPPLCARPGDTLPLARHFLAEAGELHGRQFLGFTPDAEHCLLGHGWPGNVRELRETIARIAEGLAGGTRRGEQIALATRRPPPARVPTGHPPPPKETADP